MEYFYQITDSQGYIHSIDMLYIEYFSKKSVNYVLECVRELALRYPALRYEEYLDRKACSKYDFYRDSVVIGTCFLSLGKYVLYDKESKERHLIPMYQIRFNPNKVFVESYFGELIQMLIAFGEGYLRKYDYSIDIPLDPKNVKIFVSGKEKGLYKGTRYYGQSGRHNYLKIYNKAKEIGSDVPLTRIEYTFKAGEIPRYEKVYILDSSLSSDYSGLIDTDLAIIEMYNTLLNVGIEYELKLGRRKLEKLSKYLYGSYKLLEYGDCREKLLEYVCKKFKCGDKYDDSVFMPVFDDDLGFE